MIKLSNSRLLEILTHLLVLTLIAKSISLGVLWVLPSDGVSLSLRPNLQPKFQRVDFKNMLSVTKKVQEKKVVLKADEGISITNMILKGLYGTKDQGFVIVALKATPKKTSILSVGESFSGYTLKSIGANSATFQRDGTNFILKMQNSKKVTSHISASKKKAKKEAYEEAISEKVVHRSDIAYYAKNPKQIWKEISIREVRQGKKIKGFKVTRIDPNSKLATLGLRKGDLIIKANNVELKSYRDALDIYTKIDKIDVIQIVIIRNGVEKEIVYEIN